MKRPLHNRPADCHRVRAWASAAGVLLFCALACGQDPVVGATLVIQTDLPQAGGYYKTFTSSFTLHGTADAVRTQSIRVNGLPAEWSPRDGTWQFGEASGGPEAIVVQGSVWRYLDDGSDQGAAWREPGFDDSPWKSGPAELGYGDGGEATVVGYGPNANNKYITTYFRRSFDVPDASAYAALKLRLLRDDGAVVYLNGAEVVRSNMPTGPIGYATLATASVSGADEGTFWEFAVSPSPLHSGTNVLAVEIHQAAVTSSDISFDLVMEGIRPSATEGILLPGINRVTVQAFDGPAGTGLEVDRGTLDIWYDTGSTNDYPRDDQGGGPVPAGLSLAMMVRDSYLPGIPILVRVEVMGADGKVDRDLWDATATLSVDNPAVRASTSQISLVNGLGSSLVVFTGNGRFALTATVNGLKASRWLTDLMGQPMTPATGTLAGDTTWTGIIHVTGDVLVPAGHVLTIQPGALVLLDGVGSGSGGMDIDVQGAIQSLGTATSPVTFTAFNPAKAWGEIHHDHAAPSLYQYTDITLAGHSPGGGHTGTGPAIRPVGSKIVFDHVGLTDNVGKVMQSSAGSDLTFCHCLLARSVMGPEIEGTALSCEESWIAEMANPDDSDGIYIHDQLAGQVCLMRGGVVAHVDDDCVDTLGCDLTLEDQILRDAKDKGVSIYGGKVAINHCLVVANNKAPEDPTVATLAAKTFEGSTAVVAIDRTTIVASKVQGYTDIGIQSHNKYAVKSGTITYNVTNSIIQATDPVNVQSPYLASDVHISTTDVSGEPWPGTGNLNTDPLFADAAAHDYHLQEASPCRRAGLADGNAIDLGYYPYSEPGASNSDMVWKAAQGPYRVNGELAIAADTTLTIEPGTTVFFDPGARLSIRGQLIAEGTEYQPIRFTRTPQTGGTWNGIQFKGTSADNRLRWAILEYGRTNDGMLGVEGSTLLVEHVTFDHTDLRRVRTQGSSLVVRDCVFTDIFDANQSPTTDNLSEHIWGSVSAGGQFLAEHNIFGRVKGHNDCIDVDGPSRPAGVIEICDNTFLGGGDDALDLEGDAHIEGNLFMHFHKDRFNTIAGNGNVISAGAGKDYVVVRNVFYDADHVAQVKDGAFMTFVNNTAVQITGSALYFELPGHTLGPGRGAYVDGCIFWRAAEPLFDQTARVSQLTVNRSILPEAWHVLGSDDIEADPLFVDPNADWHLLPGSVAKGTGPWGLDRGAYVPAGAVIQGAPDSVTGQTTVVLTVGGPGITHYRYAVNAPQGPWSAERSVDVPILLEGMERGQAYTVYVIGEDSAGQWQAVPTQTAPWTVH